MIPHLLLHPVQRAIGQLRLRLPAHDDERRIPRPPERRTAAPRAIDALVRNPHPPRRGPHTAIDRQRLKKRNPQIERKLRLHRARLVAGKLLDQYAEIVPRRAIARAPRTPAPAPRKVGRPRRHRQRAFLIRIVARKRRERGWFDGVLVVGVVRVDRRRSIKVSAIATSAFAFPRFDPRLRRELRR